MAVVGGLVLSTAIVLVCVSVLGRGANTFANWDVIETGLSALSERLVASGIGPVPGDFELVEAGMAFTIFAFLPICQLRRGHATVDVFTSFLPERANRWLIAFWEVCLSAAIALITWRLAAGLQDKMRTEEITFILGFPLWWAYAASLLAAATATLVALYCAYERVRDASQSKTDTGELAR